VALCDLVFNLRLNSSLNLEVLPVLVRLVNIRCRLLVLYNLKLHFHLQSACSLLNLLGIFSPQLSLLLLEHNFVLLFLVKSFHCLFAFLKLLHYIVIASLYSPALLLQPTLDKVRIVLFLFFVLVVHLKYLFVLFPEKRLAFLLLLFKLPNKVLLDLLLKLLGVVTGYWDGLVPLTKFDWANL
jgi:hypothetical protein